MQSGFTGHVTPGEWRWVLIVSIMLVGLAFIPFLWIFANNNPESGWQFMGALHAHVDASAYLSRIRQGMDGKFLVQFMHTPETHPAFIMQPIYPLLGQVSRLASDRLSPILVFHVARVSVTVFMYLALYQLAATIWMRVRTRRIFFVLAAVGSGFGWLLMLVTGSQNALTLPIDMILPQMSPFFAGLVSVHAPLAIACLVLIVAIIIAALRPGVEDAPNVRNSGVVTFSLSIVLVFLYPEAYILLAVVLIITVGIHWYFARKVTHREMLWVLWTLVPALPILIYYVLIIRSNPFVTEWIVQRASQTVDPIQLFLGLGGVFVIGLPSIARAIRRFESDGDRFMIIWLVVACVGGLVPLAFQAHLLAGVMIPVAYFAARSIEDYWMKRFSRPYRYRIFATIVPFVMLSNLFVLMIPVIPLASSNPTNSAGLVVSSEYRAALEWLNNQARQGDVVLSSFEIGTWIPAWLGTHAVIGHHTETMEAIQKGEVVAQWYQLDSSADCDQSLASIQGFQQRYGVDFVIFGPLEASMGEAACLRHLSFIASFGDVQIYQVPITFPR